MNFALKKIIGICLFGIIILLVVVFGTIQYNSIIVGMILGVLSIAPGILILTAVLSDPLLDVVEGRGFACFDIGSPGIIQPYNVIVQMPNIILNTPQGERRGIFDRLITSYLMPAKKGIAYKVKETPEGQEPWWKNYEPKEGDTIIVLKKEEYTKSQQSMRGRPTFLYNSKTGTFITKEFIAEAESKIMTEHLCLNVLASMREFKLAVSQLNKHFADLFKPNNMLGFLRSPWIGLVIAFIIIALLVMFLGPQLPNLIKSFTGAVEGTVNSGAGAVTPAAPSLPPSPLT